MSTFRNLDGRDPFRDYDSWKLASPPEYDGPDDPPEDDEPDDEDATPILDDPEDPGEHLEPHQPDLGDPGA